MISVSLPTGTSSPSSSNSPLRLPQITLPTFMGNQKRTSNVFWRSVLQSSSVPSQHFVTYLKQQLLHDSHAYKIVCKAEEEYASLIELTESSNVVTPKQYLQYFNAIKETLITKQGKPKEDKIRDLLDDYHSLKQGPNETIPQFSHHFLEIQHSLEKLILKVHFVQENNDVELCHSFLIKWRPEIFKHLVSRDTKFFTL